MNEHHPRSITVSVGSGGICANLNRTKTGVFLLNECECVLLLVEIGHEINGESMLRV